MSSKNRAISKPIWKRMIPELMHVGAFLCNFLMNVFVKPDEQSKLLALCHGEKRYIKWTNRSFSFKTVQRCYGRTSKQPLHVRLYTLTPYVQATFERTSTQPCPYEQRFFYRWKRVFFALQLPFLRVSGIAYLQARSSLLDFIEISELSWMSKWKQKWRNEKHPLGLLTGLNGSVFP